MPSSLRNSQPMSFVGRTLSDAIDGTNAQRGAMAKLANLIPNPRTLGTWVCRPGYIDLTTFFGFLGPGFISAWRVVGNIGYGMIATSRNPGRDEPFAFDLTTATFQVVGGVTAANTPVSPPTTGDWEPPIMKKVGSRIIVTHPGFTDDEIKFGWFDVSGFTLDTTGNLNEQRGFIGDTDVAHQPYIVGLAPGTLPGDADIGFTVTGAGIPANTTIVDVEDVSVAFSADTSTSVNLANIAIDGTPDTTGLYVGQVVQGADIAPNSTIATINRGAFTATLSQATVGTNAGEALAALGRQVKLSSNTTGTADGVTFTFFNPFAITGNPSIVGIQPGMSVTAPVGVAPDTSVVSAVRTQAQVTVALSLGTNLALVYVDPGGLSVGMEVSGLGIIPGTTLLAVAHESPPSTIVLSQPPTLAGYSLLTFTGAQIIVTPTLTGSVPNSPITIAGGTDTAPLWGAGDTSPNPLPSRPIGVGQMNGRAWYALGDDGIVFSDALLPCIVSNTTAVQALLPGNGKPVTTIGELQLSSLVGGIVQALVAFQGDGGMQQITGDPTTANLSMNSMPVATGTHAPLTICSSTKGLYFVSPEGLRLIDFQAKVSDPIGQDGSGVVGPFLLVTNPPIAGPLPASRMCAAANGRNIRITVPVDGGHAEYWFDTTRGIWTGPHSSTADQIQNWSNTFVLAPTGRPAVLARSDDTQLPTSTYNEAGLRLSWEYETCLLPDTGAMAENCIIESAFGVALPPAESVQVDFLNEVRENLDGVTLAGWSVPQAIWGQMVLGYTVAGPVSGAYMQRMLPWSQPLVFKQGLFNIRGNSSASLVVGNLYFRYQVLGYMMQGLPNAP